jgi:hypothetical protein
MQPSDILVTVFWASAMNDGQRQNILPLANKGRKLELGREGRVDAARLAFKRIAIEVAIIGV